MMQYVMYIGVKKTWLANPTSENTQMLKSALQLVPVSPPGLKRNHGDDAITSELTPTMPLALWAQVSTVEYLESTLSHLLSGRGLTIPLACIGYPIQILSAVFET